MANKYASSLIDFLNESPCNFLAAKTLSSRLEEAGYRRLNLGDAWSFHGYNKFYVVKNDSAVFAVSIGSQNAAQGFRVITAHSDSP